ncbi:MAG: hypothetical protein U0U66_00235 [Cytophagaceae bacterium]
MNLIEKLHIALFAKSSDKIISKDGVFEFKMPSGYFFIKSKGVYQIFKPNDKGFLFQWSGFVLPEKLENKFDVDLELKRELTQNSNAKIQFTGNYYCVCSATISEDNSVIVYTWKIGEANKRILVTLILDGSNTRDKIDSQIYFAGELMRELKIKK